MINMLRIAYIWNKYIGIIMEYVYYFLFAYFVMIAYVNTTVIPFADTQAINGIMLNVLLVYLGISFVSVVFETDKKIGIIKCLIAIITVTMAYLISMHSNDEWFFILMVLIVCAERSKIKNIARIYIFIAVIIHLIATYGILNDFIPDFTYNFNIGKERHSYGVIYTTDFASHILYIMIAYVILRNIKLKIWEIGVCVAAIPLIYFNTYGRNFLVCSSVLIVMVVLIKIANIRDKKFFTGRIGVSLYLIMPLLVFTMIIMSYFYDSNNDVFITINKFFSNRLALSHVAFEKYDITLFGNVVNEAGAGFGGDVTGNYFYIDSMYVRILIKYGIAGFVLMIIMNTALIKIARKNNDEYMLAILIVIAVHGFIEQHLMEIAYFPFWVYIANYKNNISKLEDDDPNRTQEIKKERYLLHNITVERLVHLLIGTVIVLFVMEFMIVNTGFNTQGAIVNDGCYEIRGNSGKEHSLLMIYWTESENAVFREVSDGPQCFYFERGSNDTYKIWFGDIGKCLTGYDNGDVGISDFMGDSNQYWKLKRIRHSQYFQVQNVGTGKSLHWIEKDGGVYKLDDYSLDDRTFEIWIR